MNQVGLGEALHEGRHPVVVRRVLPVGGLCQTRGCLMPVADGLRLVADEGRSVSVEGRSVADGGGATSPAEASVCQDSQCFSLSGQRLTHNSNATGRWWCDESCHSEEG